MAHWKANRKTRRVPKIESGLMLMPEVLTDRASSEALDVRDQLERFGGSLGKLDAGVQVLGVLAHDHEVDVLVPAAHPRI